MERVVSLLPSATESVFTLGCGERLVGRSHECDLPAEARRLPVVTAPRLDPAAPGAEIDARVRELVRRALSIYDVDADRLRGLRPDGILTQNQCQVCAVTPRDLEAALASWLGEPPHVVSLSPTTLRDVLDDGLRIAEALGVPERGRRLRAEQEERLDAIAKQTAALAARPRVACLEWIEPLMGAGNWVPELVARAGGEALLAAPDRHAPWTSFEALRRADPDAIVILPCGFDLARTRAELSPLLERPGWPELRAVRGRRVFLADGNRHFNRPGPRIAESCEILAEMLHPERFHFGHQDSGWERLEEGDGT